MYQQRVQTRPLNGLRGIGVVLAVVAAAVIGSAFFTLLENSIGSLSSLCFIRSGLCLCHGRQLPARLPDLWQTGALQVRSVV